MLVMTMVMGVFHGKGFRRFCVCTSIIIIIGLKISICCKVIKEKSNTMQQEHSDSKDFRVFFNNIGLSKLSISNTVCILYR